MLLEDLLHELLLVVSELHHNTARNVSSRSVGLVVLEVSGDVGDCNLIARRKRAKPPLHCTRPYERITREAEPCLLGDCDWRQWPPLCADRRSLGAEHVSLEYLLERLARLFKRRTHVVHLLVGDLEVTRKLLLTLDLEVKIDGHTSTFGQ